MTAGNATICIIVNGEPREVSQGLTLPEVLVALGAPRDGVAVERNGCIVSRSKHAETKIVDGDKLEIVTFVGGG